MTDKTGKVNREIALISCSFGASHGIRLLSAFLKRKEYKTRLFFTSREFGGGKYPEKVMDELKRLVMGCDIIGVSGMGFTAEKITQIAKALDNKVVIAGGIYPTTNPQGVLRDFNIVCIGEGEEAFIEFAEKYNNGGNIYNIRNFWFKNNGQIIKNDVRPIIDDLNTLPFEDIDYKNHFIIKPTGIEKYKRETYSKEVRFYSVVGMRGCPQHCTFCCNSFFQKLYKGKGGIIRKKSIRRVIKEFELLIKKFGGTDICYMCDEDYFVRTIDEIKEFSRLFKKLSAKYGGLRFWANCSPMTANEEKLKILLDCGLIANSAYKGDPVFNMGIQSGSDKMLREYKRASSTKMIRRASKIISKCNIHPLYDIIIANPYEKSDTILETIRLISELETPFILAPHLLTFFHGSELYERAERDGFAEYSEYSDHDAKFKLLKGKEKYLNELLWRMGGRFTRNRCGAIPRFLVPFLINKHTIPIFSKPFISDIVIFLVTFPYKVGSKKKKVMRVIDKLLALMKGKKLWR